MNTSIVLKAYGGILTQMDVLPSSAFLLFLNKKLITIFMIRQLTKSKIWSRRRSKIPQFALNKKCKNESKRVK